MMASLRNPNPDWLGLGIPKSNMGKLRNPGHKSNVSLTQLTEVETRLIIGPESDHCLLLSLTESQTHCTN